MTTNFAIYTSFVPLTKPVEPLEVDALKMNVLSFYMFIPFHYTVNNDLARFTTQKTEQIFIYLFLKSMNQHKCMQ